MLRTAINHLQRLRTLRLVRGPFSYDMNGLWTRHNADFQRDPIFVAACEEAAARTGYCHPAPWRVQVNVWAARHGLALGGDLVECGVWKGYTAFVVARCAGLERNGRRFFLVDSFDGCRLEDLSPAELQAGLAHKNPAYRDQLAVVRHTFHGESNVEIVPGFVPDVLPAVGAERVGYLHIDMHTAVPEIAAAEHFWDRLLPGAVVVLQAYGFHKHRAQKKAFDAFAARRGITILPLPTGQGLYLKPWGP